ncbi:hypothetical protein [Micromonospora sediminicola]|uniref:hypothetical protein n=1 Tax=Micromonospora sediminicola TaxID=946078 RepID=UPI0037B8FC21
MADPTDDRPGYELRGYAPLPPRWPGPIADPNMPHGAYRRHPGYQPPRRPLLDDNARLSGLIAAAVLGLAVLVVVVLTVPVLLCPLAVLVFAVGGVVARRGGWRPRQRLL